MEQEKGSFVDTDIIFEGSIISEENIIIKGKLTGKLESIANIFVEKEGSVSGEIETNSIQNYGTIRGKLVSNLCEVYKGAKHLCDVKTNIIFIEKGAGIKGSLLATPEKENMVLNEEQKNI